MSKTNSTSQIKKLLVANRGEIAVRIMRTAQKLGIATVGVYSDADAGAWHTEVADEAVRIGKAESRDSYLNIERIIAAAQRTGADAVHPGYGFLSENPTFAKALKAAGIKLVGPSAKVIALMGDKLAAKKLAHAAGVPLVPGISLSTNNKNVAEVTKFVAEVGFPVLIKAASGGGGRGMRRINSAADIPDALNAASREAEAFFSDGRIFVEKLIEPARHLEVQILGDSQGNVVVIGDRDCTWQRHHQKVIEEAPAPGLSPNTRKKLHTAAKELGEAAGYESAGTVEFLLDKTGAFYFLEVNSRLQVEHPVTEAVTGLDLVALQLQIAAGGALPKLLRGQNLEPRGAAIECRICAESPEEGFVSSTGIIRKLELPQVEHRFDTGFRVGDRVTHYYDSLVGKLIVAAATRDELIDSCDQALSELIVTGIKTNIGFVRDLVGAQTFRKLDHDINDAINHVGGGSKQLQLRKNQLAAMALLVDLFREENCSAPEDLWNHRSGFRLFGVGTCVSTYRIFGEPIEARGNILRDGSVSISTKNSAEPEIYKNISSCCGELIFDRDQEQHVLKIDRVDDLAFWLHTLWGAVLIQKITPALKSAQSGAASGNTISNELCSPLPGKIISVKIKAGEKVAAGAVLLVLESMKMEHPIRATKDGVIEKIYVTQGQVIEQGMVVVAVG